MSFLYSMVLIVHNGVNDTVDFLTWLEAVQPREQGFELQVVDDGSTDATHNLLSSLEGMVAISRNDTPLGPLSLVNAARECESPYVVLSTANLRLPAGWADAMRECLEANPSLDGVQLPVQMTSGLQRRDVSQCVMIRRSSFANDQSPYQMLEPVTYDAPIELSQVITSMRWKVTTADIPPALALTTYDQYLTRTSTRATEDGIAVWNGTIPSELDEFVRLHPEAFSTGLHVAAKCPICGELVAIPAKRSSPSFREQLTCPSCLTSSRYRSLARGLLKAIQELTGVSARSLAELPTSGSPRSLNVYDTQLPFYYDVASYPIPDLLNKCDWISVTSSVFLPDKPWGLQVGENKTNQNLEQLTYDDKTFDIILTSEVMEHVRLWERAHEEVFRVLKEDGMYIFTVPHSQALEQTKIQVVIHDEDDPLKDEIIGEPEYHGTATAGEPPVLSYRIYGRDFETYLDKLGFDLEYTKEDYPAMGILETELFYCRKR